MPTKRRRHSITETEPIAKALATARAIEGPGHRDSALLAELIVLGADAKLNQAERSEIDLARRRAIRRQFLRLAEDLDLDSLEHVRRTGWARERGVAS